VISGLDFGSISPADAQIQMLIEYLVGESGDVRSQESAVCISRLIIAGDSLASLAPIVTEPGPTLEDKKAVGFFSFILVFCL
jgi:DNA polymerase delta subunit 2